MKKKLTLEAIEFFKSVFCEKDIEKSDELFVETQNFINILLEEIVFDFEPAQDYESAYVNYTICCAVYVPIILFQKNVSYKKAEKIVKNEIDEVIANYRIERDLK